VEVERWNGWQVDIAEALDIQKRLANKVSKVSEVEIPRFIAGVDISTRKDGELATGAVVVLNYPELEIVETKVVKGKVSFPYVPGLLSFREVPLIPHFPYQTGLIGIFLW